MRFVFALFCLFAFPALAAETQYFSALPDLPLAPHLVEETDSAVRFDQPEGRIITSQASGNAQVYDIDKFYSVTLPALGWKQTGPHHYVRAKESLTLDVKPAGKGASRLNILLKPQ